MKENKILKQKLTDAQAPPAAAIPVAAPSAVAAGEVEQLKKRLKLETEANQRQLKIIEGHEATAKVCLVGILFLFYCFLLFFSFFCFVIYH